MHPLLSLGVFWLLPLAFTLEEDSPLDCFPRRTVLYHRDNAYLFHEEGVYNYSTMLLREDLGLLMLGAREALYALDLNDISKKQASVKWEVTQEQQDACKNKGKDPKLECKNYIRILQKMEDGRMYVCGTNAFDPECDYMSYTDGNLTLEKREDDGKGLCPFDPFQRHASIMVDDSLYSATSMNFLGSEPVLMRSPPESIRTDFKSSWLNEPSFISMIHMPEGDNSPTGDDDKVYLFFSETAVECDCYNKLVVNRVARVCKGDLGGERTLQKKWTSFLKARLDCPVLESQLPFLIQDTYRWCDPQRHWQDCLFYAVFTPQSDTSDLSAVCAYNMLDIARVFSEGKYKAPVHVETSFVKWVMYSGDVPVPRPGACIDNDARKEGINQTLDLPDRTLQFIRDKPLMDQVINPEGKEPLLVRRGAKFTCIVVNQVQAADGKMYDVMFVGTEDGTILKAVNYGKEMFIIEEVHLFMSPEPIKTLQFSQKTGWLYAGSDSGAVQMPLATCQRSSSCMDCVLARDPYCGWDKDAGKCTALSTTQKELIQSVKDGDASICPDAGPIKTLKESIWPGGNLKLDCPKPSNLATTSWERDDRPLTLSSRHELLQDGLLILNASLTDAGLYRCVSIERSKTDVYTSTVARYDVTVTPLGSGRGRNTLFPEAQRDGPSVAGLQAVVALLTICLVGLLGWNCYKGHLPVPWKNRNKNGGQSQENHEQGGLNGSGIQQDTRPENKPLVSVVNSGGSNNNHNSEEAANSGADAENVNQQSLQYIDDVSEI